MNNKTKLALFGFYSLLTYRLSKLLQVIFQNIIEGIDPIIVSNLFWLGLAAWPAWRKKQESGLIPDIERIKKSKKELIVPVVTLILGLIVFIFFGITKLFHNVQIPIFFIVLTPFIEELIFRGWLWGKLEPHFKIWTIVITAAFFSLHHLEYYNFQLSYFVIFQIIYTFALGMILGRVRSITGSIYVGLLLHILLNLASFVF